jgi:methoxymalonate biosynthesis acyl carrier protein
MPTEPSAAPATAPELSEEEITRFVLERFLPGVESGLDPDYDLLATGVIDSLGVLHIAGWLDTRFGIVLPDRELAAGNFRSVAAIRATAERAGTRA